MTKPIASVSLDLDNKWSYMKTHGDPGWESFPSYLNIVVPRVLEFLQKRQLKITFFIVGQDAALDCNRDALRSISRMGHEIGNHSFNHEPWLHLYSPEQLETEFQQAEEHIERATGERPVGFRGPGFSLSSDTLKVLIRRGYLYDASTFPTFLGPLARAYYFMTAKLQQSETEQRKALFGRFQDGFRPLRPYRWRTEGGEIIEIPVTTMPIFRVPIHLSYLLYLDTWSPALCDLYLRIAITLSLWTKTRLSFLLHPLDFLGHEDDGDLDFFPGMRLARDAKLERVSRVFEKLAKNFEIIPMRQHAVEAAAGALPSRSW